MRKRDDDGEVQATTDWGSKQTTRLIGLGKAEAR
jgi:hypothetical protein